MLQKSLSYCVHRLCDVCSAQFASLARLSKQVSRPYATLARESLNNFINCDRCAVVTTVYAFMMTIEHLCFHKLCLKVNVICMLS